MNTSTHYNLNLVEGTDLVNPLVQDVPNYEAIDAQMYANECASIATAVELLTGTVHALTRANENAPVFRFTATSDFTAGETFVVDGTQVTALLPSGEALGTGAYVIGSEVICALRDTRLTFYTSGGIQSVAADSEKLGGELPAHYATASAVETAQATATAAGVLAQSNTSQIAELNDSLANSLVYNPTDDYIYIGETKWKLAGLQFNGTVYEKYSGFSNNISLGSNAIWDSSWTGTSLSYSNGVLSGTNPSTQANEVSNFIDYPIDFSNYTTLYATATINGSQKTATVDLSDVNVVGYIYLRLPQKGSATQYFYDVGVCGGNSGYVYDTYIKRSSTFYATSPSLVTFDKIWLV